MGLHETCKLDCGRVKPHAAPGCCLREEPEPNGQAEPKREDTSVRVFEPHIGPGVPIPRTDPGFTPFEPGTHHVPDYYRATQATEHIQPGADVIELWEAWGVADPLIGSALKYLIRAGRKPGESAAKDLSKACEVIQRRISALSRPPHGKDCG